MAILQSQKSMFTQFLVVEENCHNGKTYLSLTVKFLLALSDKTLKIA